MKLKRFIEILNEKIEDFGDFEYDDDFMEDEDRNALESHIRSLFNKKGIVAEVEFVDKVDGEVLEIRLVRPFSDSLSNLLKMMETIDLLSDELMGEYDNSFDLWYTKEKKPMFTLTFLLGKN